MNAKLIVQMEDKKTRLLKHDSSASDAFHDFTFDYSYWSFCDNFEVDLNESQMQHAITQDEVYNDLGIDVVNSAFQGNLIS